jgi:hypothetical protein
MIDTNLVLIVNLGADFFFNRKKFVINFLKDVSEREGIASTCEHKLFCDCLSKAKVGFGLVSKPGFQLELSQSLPAIQHDGRDYIESDRVRKVRGIY